jgi:hypothetical protein
MSNETKPLSDSLQSDLEKLAFRAKIWTLDGQALSIGTIMPPIPDTPGQFWPDDAFEPLLRSHNPKTREVVATTMTHQYRIRGWTRCGDDPNLPSHYEFVDGLEAGSFVTFPER